MAIVQSFGGIIYILKDWEPYFLVIKRQSMSKKIERTAPKWKPEQWETPLEAAKREIFEETNLNVDLLDEKWKLGDFLISFSDSSFEKKVTYFLFEYKWNETDPKISNTEWYIWVYNWLAIWNVLNIIHYNWLRELYRKAYEKIIS